MAQPDVREPLHERLSRARHLLGVVVGLVVRHHDAVGLGLGDRVLDPELQAAERLGLEIERDAVLALLERTAARVEENDLAEREIHRTVAAEVLGADLGAVVEVQTNVGGIDVDLVDPHAVNAGQPRVAQSILEPESNAVGDVLEAPEGIQLPQDQRRYLHGTSPLSGALGGRAP